MRNIDQKLSLAPAGLLHYLDTWGQAGQRAQAVLQDVGLLSNRLKAGLQKSRLTPTGVPLEFGFAEFEGGLRYTVEVGRPGINPSRRMDEICALLQDRGAPLPSEEARRWVTQMQAKRLLTYGAWLGVRHTENEDRFKIYAELPPEAAQATDAWLTDAVGHPHLALGPAPKIKMVGLDAEGDGIELYYASTDLLRTAVRLLLRRAGLFDSSEQLLALIDSMTAFPPGAALPARDVGFSYALSPSTAEITFSLFLVAQKLFGDDQTCFEWITQHGRLDGYEAMSKYFSPTPAGKIHHGMIGLTVAAGFDNPILSTGVAAPWTL